MLNYLWLGLIIGSVLLGGFAGRLPAVAEGAVEGAKTAVTLALGMLGVMALWLGMMRLAEKAGLVAALARILRPVLGRLFPDVPRDHPAMGSMVLNIAANMLGLLNAATPLGLRAMKDLESLNRRPGTATNAMCTFLAINTGSVQLIPVTAIAVLAAAGSKNPSAIVGTALLATCFSSAAGLLAVKWLERWPVFRLPPAESSPEPGPADSPEPAPSPASAPAPESPAGAAPDAAPVPWWGRLLLAGFLACTAWFLCRLAVPGGPAAAAPAGLPADGPLVRWVNAVSLLAVPFLLAFFPLYAAVRRVAVYEEFVEGAREGFQVAVRIIPFLVAMLGAIGMFRGAGGIELLTGWLRPALDLVGFPSELLPLALMRPLSGSASLALFSDLVKQWGPDNLLVRMAGTLYGSTETTFYVVTVYFGAVAVRRTRHAVAAGLVADAAGAVASVVICRLVFGGS